MNASVKQPVPRGQNRWLTLALIIFSLELSLVWLIGERWQAATPALAPMPVGLLPKPLSDDQIADNIFAIHPTVFPEPSRHGFSGGAWLHGPGQAYATPEREEPAHWLDLPTERLATTLPPIAPARSSIPFELAEQNDPPVELALLNLPPEKLRTNSTLRLESALAARQLDAPTALPLWSSSQLVTNSLVQIAVDGSGEVISTRLLGRSGSAAADDAAMEQARNFHFRPAAAFSKPVWGKAIFEWMTLPATNSATSPP